MPFAVTPLRSCAALALILAATSSAPAQTAGLDAQAAPIAPGTLLATVGGRPITQADMAAAVPDIGPELARIPDEKARQSALLDYRIDAVLAAQQALRDKDDQKPDYAARLAYAINKVLAEAVLTQTAERATAEPALRQRYADLVKQGALKGTSNAAPPSFEEVRDELARDAALQAQRELLSELRKSAKIEYFAQPASEMTKVKP